MSDAGNLLNVGDTFKKNGVEFEIIHVSCQEDENGKPINFIYEAITSKEADALRKANEERLDQPQHDITE